LSAATAPSAAADSVGQLPDVRIPVTPAPPYSPGFLVGETRLPLRGHVDNAEVVRVGLDPEGAMQTVAVDQRLTVRGLGDIVVNIPAPALGVSALPDSEAVPGIRRYSVVWQGFSPGRKVLAARVQLRTLAIARLVPLQVRVDRKRLAGGAFQIAVSVLDAARGSTRTFGGNANPADVAEKLDDILGAFRAGRRPAPALVTVPGTFTSQVTPVVAGFTVDAELTVPGRFEDVHAQGARVVGRSPLRLRFTGTASGFRPDLKVSVSGRGSALGQPHLRLVARPAPPAALLVPPGGKTWADALRAGLFPRDGRKALALAIERLSSAAFTNQYEKFLASPDLAGQSQTTYVFETAAAPQALPATGSTGSGADWTLRGVGIALAVLATGGLVVWWAHS
jgi:hypothetical protein